MGGGAALQAATKEKVELWGPLMQSTPSTSIIVVAWQEGIAFQRPLPDRDTHTRTSTPGVREELTRRDFFSRLVNTLEHAPFYIQ